MLCTYVSCPDATLINVVAVSAICFEPKILEMNAQLFCDTSCNFISFSEILLLANQGLYAGSRRTREFIFSPVSLKTFSAMKYVTYAPWLSPKPCNFDATNPAARSWRATNCPTAGVQEASRRP